MDDDHSQLVALIKDKSLRFGDFVLASGQRSDYYIDCRKATMSAAGLRLIGILGLRKIREMGWKVAAVGGMTLGADPVSYAIAMASNADPPALDAFTVRKEAKRHGTGSPVEGCLPEGGRVVVIEDVITTGGSALKAIEAAAGAGAEVAGVLAVVDRRGGGREAIESAGFSTTSLVDLSELGVGRG